ncbi:MAG: hypothetical protein K2G64_07775 [Muribaculaceae bacterium]|nr:hypothetical protein [Muribaculaceae bacterium]
MKKQLLISGFLTGMLGVMTMTAAPVPQKSISELLGLREVPSGFASAPVARGVNLQNVTTPPRICGKDTEKAGVGLNASVV